MAYVKHYNPTVTPQNEAQPGKPQVKNAASGYVFPVDKWTCLDRFLIIGSEKPTYYASGAALTKENAKNVLDCLQEDSYRTINRIIEISESKRAPKNDPAIYALALAASAELPATRANALNALGHVCRTGTHLFQFAAEVNEMRGWGRGLRQAIAGWYLSRDPESLAYQLVKYVQRKGWSHRDLLRLSHPKTETTEFNSLFKYVVNGMKDYPTNSPPKRVMGLEKLRGISHVPSKAANIIRCYQLPREAVELVNTELLQKKEIWEALLESMPITAMIRNLGKMTAIELLTPMSAAVKHVVKTLSDKERIIKSGVHPIAILMAMNTYLQGHGDKGKLHWTPLSSIGDALNDAFYASFANVAPTGKRRLLAIDTSGSMTWPNTAVGGVTARVASAAIALITKAAEPETEIINFSEKAMPLDISPKRRLDDVISYIDKQAAAATDCSQPVLYAARKKLLFDSIEIYTDNETWAGKIHPSQALREYRAHFGLRTKMVVAAMTPVNYSIADPADGGMLDVVGFDAAVPSIIADFVRGGGSSVNGSEEREED